MTQQEHYSLRWNNHQSHILGAFDALLQTKTLVDVTLVCAETSIRAHKVVLSACSPFFQRVFSETPCKHPVIVLKDFRGWVVQAIVDFMYRGEISVPQERLQILIQAGESLQVRGLVDHTTCNNIPLPALSPDDDDFMDTSVGVSPTATSPVPPSVPTQTQAAFSDDTQSLISTTHSKHLLPPHVYVDRQQTQTPAETPETCTSPMPRRKQARPRRRSGECAPHDLTIKSTTPPILTVPSSSNNDADDDDDHDDDDNDDCVSETAGVGATITTAADTDIVSTATTAKEEPTKEERPESSLADEDMDNDDHCNEMDNDELDNDHDDDDDDDDNDHRINDTADNCEGPQNLCTKNPLNNNNSENLSNSNVTNNNENNSTSNSNNNNTANSGSGSNSNSGNSNNNNNNSNSNNNNSNRIVLSLKDIRHLNRPSAGLCRPPHPHSSSSNLPTDFSSSSSSNNNNNHPAFLHAENLKREAIEASLENEREFMEQMDLSMNHHHNMQQLQNARHEIENSMHKDFTPSSPMSLPSHFHPRDGPPHPPSPLPFPGLPSALTLTPPHHMFGLDSPLGLFPPGMDPAKLYNPLMEMSDPRGMHPDHHGPPFLKKKMSRPKGQHSAPRGGPPRSWTNAELTEALQHVWNKKMTTSQASRIFGIPYNSLLMYVRGKYGKSLKLEQLRKDCISGPPIELLTMGLNVHNNNTKGLNENRNKDQKDMENALQRSSSSEPDLLSSPNPMFNPFPPGFYPDFPGGFPGLPLSMLNLLPPDRHHPVMHHMSAMDEDCKSDRSKQSLDDEFPQPLALNRDERREIMQQNGQE